jgi:glycerophosphoryl diester phosphodiesterase
VSSFQLPALIALRELAPRIAVGVLFRLVPRGWSELAGRLGVVMIGADHRRLRPRRVAAIRAAGFQLAAFTVNDPARAALLFEWGVTSVFSDAPDIIRPDVMRRVSAGHAPARIFTAARRGLTLARQGANR